MRLGVSNPLSVKLKGAPSIQSALTSNFPVNALGGTEIVVVLLVPLDALKLSGAAHIGLPPVGKN